MSTGPTTYTNNNRTRTNQKVTKITFSGQLSPIETIIFYQNDWFHDLYCGEIQYNYIYLKKKKLMRGY